MTNKVRYNRFSVYVEIEDVTIQVFSCLFFDIKELIGLAQYARRCAIERLPIQWIENHEFTYEVGDQDVRDICTGNFYYDNKKSKVFLLDNLKFCSNCYQLFVQDEHDNFCSDKCCQDHIDIDTEMKSGIIE